jgi:glycosyltransferase involved in cell wall biosynthesis
MVLALKRVARETEDWLRYHPAVRRALGACRRWQDRLRPVRAPQDAARSIARLCTAARMTDDPVAIAELQRTIHERLADLDLAPADWSEFVPDIDRAELAKAAVLKPWVGPREKGVMFISFENQWIKLLRHVDLRAFAERYDLVLAPSGSPHNLINYAFAAKYPGPLFTLMSNAGDAVALPGVSRSFVVVPLYASSWVNPAWFEPLPKAERQFDLIMVANFAKFKRHHVLFQALREMSGDVRVLLIGQDQDARTRATIEDEARWYGVGGRFTLLANQGYRQVADAFCRSRASVILSRREGSCVVVAESMFADAPVAILEDAELGSRAFINEQTGVFLKERDVGRQLADFVERADRFTPRQWARDHISCWKSSQKLNEVLKAHALARGDAWTLDLAPLQWCPDPQLARPEDEARLAAERHELRARFGLIMG